MKFDKDYATNGPDESHTLQNSTTENFLAASLSTSPHQNQGRRFVTQLSWQLSAFMICGRLSEVYHATEVELAREVAVKVLRPDRIAGIQHRRFSRREVEILGR